MRLDEFPNLGSVVGAEVYEHMGAPIQRVGRFLWQCAIILVFENSARLSTSGLVFEIVLSVVDNC